MSKKDERRIDGIWKTLNNNNTCYYSILDRNTLSEIWKEIMYKEVIDQINELSDRNIISNNKKKSLIAMLISPDVESNELAKDLITEILKENGNRIHRT